MEKYDYDLLVIGGGSGGVRAARMAAAQGVRVALAEEKQLGGTCVNLGCVPKKMFVYAAHYHEDFQHAAGYGWQLPAAPIFDWPTLRDRKTADISRINGAFEKMIAQAGVELIRGRASLLNAHDVEINGQVYHAERILLAPGGQPYIPLLPGSEHGLVSDQAFYLDKLPKSILVVGGGYIAVEFAGIFNGLGIKTDLLYRRDLFLRGFDADVRTFVRDELKKKGIGLHFNTTIERIDKKSDGCLKAVLNDGQQMEAEQIFFATGRTPNIAGLGLKNAGVETDENGVIKVDKYFQSSVPSIYALGDAIGRVALTPVALAEAMNLVAHLYQNSSAEMDYSNIPTAVFCQPDIGTVGLSEEDAKEQGFDVTIFRSEFRELKHSLSGSDERSLMKLVVDKKTDRVLGVHIVGGGAAEIIQGFAVALKAGATKAIFDSTIGVHPTSAEELVTMREPV
ncbi:MAG TPA: glutathione-disulfide reductase [Geopsychrobacteraceae bacterium]|nr:glutathione-disulfide reductase [Geopsychrobacteraceae bacterium]